MKKHTLSFYSHHGPNFSLEVGFDDDVSYEETETVGNAIAKAFDVQYSWAEEVTND